LIVASRRQSLRQELREDEVQSGNACSVVTEQELAFMVEKEDWVHERMIKKLG
jgi:hypothetical protein